MDKCRALWCECLSLLIDDALRGVPKEGGKSAEVCIRETEETRRYLTIRNRDFDTVCTFAGVDPEATRDRLSALIAAAPSAHDLVTDRRQTGASKQTAKQQAPAPHQNAPKFSAFGKSMTLAEWANASGISRELLSSRVHTLNWTMERALTEPLRSNRSRNQKSAQSTIAARRAPGVGSNSARSLGTGGGRSAQETPEISFQDQEHVA